jgi:hypothetical protein
MFVWNIYGKASPIANITMTIILTLIVPPVCAALDLADW